MATRSFNPALTKAFKEHIPKFQYGFKHISLPNTCQEIIDKLDLKSKYRDGSKLDIIDIFTGFGLFSTMVNYELKPRNHIVMDSNSEVFRSWNSRIDTLNAETGNAENFVLFAQNPYNWTSFDLLINRDKLVQPAMKLRDMVHDELLIIANSSHTSFGESLFAQWMMCGLYSNWLQKYGRVRMLCIIPASTAMKFTLLVGFSKRNKTAVKLGLFNDTKLLAITSNIESGKAEGDGYDPMRILQDNPILIQPHETIPPSRPIALLEVVPRSVDSAKVDYFDFLIKHMFFNSSNKIEDSIQYLGCGAEDYMCPLVSPEILAKSAKVMNNADWEALFEVFIKWPFKPLKLELIDITNEDQRDA